MTKENRLVAKALGHSIGAIAQAIGRSKSTISPNYAPQQVAERALLAASRRRSPIAQAT